MYQQYAIVTDFTPNLRTKDSKQWDKNRHETIPGSSQIEIRFRNLEDGGKHNRENIRLAWYKT